MGTKPRRERLQKEIAITLAGVRFEMALITGDRDEQSASRTTYLWGPKDEVPWDVGDVVDGAIWEGADGLYCCVKVDDVQPRGTTGGPWVRLRELVRSDLGLPIANNLRPRDPT